MEQIHCDNCEKKKCKKRVAGAICAFNESTSDLIKAYRTRDPEVVASKFLHLIDKELERYELAIEHEKIGEDSEIVTIDKNGNEKIRVMKGRADPAITNLASSLIKNGKLLHELINPPKKAPLIQQNNQYNLNNVVVDDIEKLDKNDKENVLKFIEAKIADEKGN